MFHRKLLIGNFQPVLILKHKSHILCIDACLIKLEKLPSLKKHESIDEIIET